MINIATNQSRAAKHLVSAAQGFSRVDAVATLERRLAEFEQKHGLSTEAMREAVVSGQMAETGEVCRWLMIHNRLRTLRAG